LGKFKRLLQRKLLVYFMSNWSIFHPFGIFYVHLVYFTAIWSILLPFGILFPILVYCTKKNLATLVGRVTRMGEF
jgi:hypothetical protein